MMESRIVVLDGAMGTMIQRRELQEEDFRSGRFADWKKVKKIKANIPIMTVTYWGNCLHAYAGFVREQRLAVVD